jgi:heat shock protein HslJ
MNIFQYIKKTIVFGMALFCLTLAFQSPSYAADLKGSWQLESLGGVPVLENTKITAEFDNDRHGSISGTGGCNQYFGTNFTADSGKITTTPGGATLRRCPGPVDKQESRYFQALDSATSYNVSDKNLLLTDRSYNQSLKYVKDTGSSYPEGLKGSWHLESSGGVPVLENTEITAEFDNDRHGSISSSGLYQQLPQPASRGITTFYATPEEQKKGVEFYRGLKYDISIPNTDLSDDLPQRVEDFEAFFKEILANGRRQNGTNGSFTEGAFDFRASNSETFVANTNFEVIAPRDNRIYSVVAGKPDSKNLCPLKIGTTEVDFFLNAEDATTRAGQLDKKDFLVYVSPDDALTIKAFSKLFYDELGNKKTNPECFLVSGATQKVQTDFRKIYHLLPPSLQQDARQKPFRYSPSRDSFIYLVNARKTIQGGNPVIERTKVDDQKNDFYLVDTNNPINLDGSLTEWSIWANKNLPVQLIIYRREPDMAIYGNKAPWSVVGKSDVQIPKKDGFNEFKLPTSIQVLKGDYVGLYHPEKGSVRFTLDGENPVEGNFSGSVILTSSDAGSQSGENAVTKFASSSDRTYSVSVR